MKKYLVILFCLLSTSVFADEISTQQKIETTIGKLMVENIILTTKIESLTKEIADLKKQLEVKDKK